MEYKEIKKFIETKCENCKNKNTNKCEIRININGDLQCGFYNKTN